VHIILFIDVTSNLIDFVKGAFYICFGANSDTYIFRLCLNP